MSGQTTAMTATVGMVAAVSTGGPLSEVFGELAAVEAIMGLGGGITMAIGNRETIRETLRGGVIGMLLAVGFGALAPVVVAKVLGLPSDGTTITPQTAAAYSFAIGLGHHLIIDRMNRKKAEKS